MNTTKTVCSAFHLTNRLADYELSIATMGERIPFDKTPKCLGVILDRTLSYHQHLLNTAAKIRKRCNLLQKLASNHWGADFTTFHTSTLAICFSVAEYCCPIWSQSHHCKKVDTSLNECLTLASGCINSTPTELLQFLSGIEPMDIRRNKNILGLCIRAMENTHIFHQAALDDIDDISPDNWAQHAWRGQWENSNTSSIISLHTQALNHLAMILNEVNGYCSIASALVMVDMQASCIELVCVRMQIVYVVQFKLIKTY